MKDSCAINSEYRVGDITNKLNEIFKSNNDQFEDLNEIEINSVAGFSNLSEKKKKIIFNTNNSLQENDKAVIPKKSCKSSEITHPTFINHDNIDENNLNKLHKIFSFDSKNFNQNVIFPIKNNVVCKNKLNEVVKPDKVLRSQFTLDDGHNLSLKKSKVSDSSEKNGIGPSDEEKKRTVFVGNLPLLKVTKSHLCKLLDLKPDEIEQIRLKCPKKCIVMKKSSYLRSKNKDQLKVFAQSAFVVLNRAELIPSVLRANGRSFRDNIIRVDLAEKKDPFSIFSRKNTVFVANIPYSATEFDIYQHFGEKVNVIAARIIRDKVSGLSKGFGFVLFPNRADAKKAINLFNDKELMGFKLRVTKALSEVDISTQKASGQSTKKSQGLKTADLHPAVLRIRNKKILKGKKSNR